MALNERIQRWREAVGLERVQLASKMLELGRKTSEHDIWRWESGRNVPDPLTLNVMAQALGIDINLLMNTDPTPKAAANG